MRGFSVPAAYTTRPDDNVTDDLFRHADDAPGGVGLRVKVNGAWTPVTWREVAGEVRALAAGFIAAGIGPGERVALMSRTRFEWTVLDYAILTAGAVTVPIYPTSSQDQIAWILGDSGATAVVVETDDHAEKVDAAQASLPALARVWQIDGTRFPSLSDIRARGAQVPGEQVEERRRSRQAQDLAEIVYTSGTTGRPKGCMLSHGNIVANVRNCVKNDGFEKIFNEHHSTLLFLPLSHSFAQLIQYGAIHSGTVLGLADMADAAAELPAYRPTVVLSVPRLWQKAHQSAQRKAAEEGHGRIFAAAEACAIAYSERLDTGRPGLLLRFRHALFDRLVYRKLRAAFGGQMDHAWSAAAPLGPQLGHFLRGCGINVLEGYGLTETSPATNTNAPDAQKIGTVGRPIPGCSIRIGTGSEVLVKGHMVFQGYWNNQSATNAILDEEGWLHTGDIGSLDDDGYLTITGRQKDLLITASGKNVAPAALEEPLRAHWLISECIVVGEGKPYIAALVAIDREAFAQWKAAHGKPPSATVADLRHDPALRADIQAAVDDANNAVSHAEAIKKFTILSEDFTEAAGQLTPTLKPRRHVLMNQYAAEIEALYGSSS
jgi:long-chain acyl-CoA synthetase